MADAGTIETERRMKALDKRLQSIYSQSYKTAVENNNAAIKKLASLPPDAPIAQRTAWAAQVKRTTNIINNIASELAQTGETAAKMIQGEMTNIYGLNNDYTGWTVSKQTGLNLNFTIYDKNQIAAIINSEQSPFSKIAYNNLGKDAQIVQRLGNELAIATVNGESQRQIIKRIRNVTGQSVKQARRVAQTERTRIQSQGRNMGINEAQSMGIEMDKQWVARMINTRDLHIIANGEIVAAGEDFSIGLAYPGDPKGDAANVINCHCYEKPMVRFTSPALAAHRAKFSGESFKEYHNQREEKRRELIEITIPPIADRSM